MTVTMQDAQDAAIIAIAMLLLNGVAMVWLALALWHEFKHQTPEE